MKGELSDSWQKTNKELHSNVVVRSRRGLLCAARAVGRDRQLLWVLGGKSVGVMFLAYPSGFFYKPVAGWPISLVCMAGLACGLSAWRGWPPWAGLPGRPGRLAGRRARERTGRRSGYRPRGRQGSRRRVGEWARTGRLAGLCWLAGPAAWGWTASR